MQAPSPLMIYEPDSHLGRPGRTTPGRCPALLHQLRHSHATELINAGVSIEVVRKRLGHASTETTQVYTLLAG
ncbi:tyrosine-type recombinase/integrase [Nocardia rhamnosiphila]